MRETVEVALPHGSSIRRFTVPAANLRQILRPNPGDAPPGPERKLIREALENPIGSPRLEEIVKPSDTVTVIVDDITRPTPASPIVSEVLDRLQAVGVPMRNVTIVIALGTHRAMRDEEIARRLDTSIRSRVRVVNHDFRDPTKLLQVGTSADGIPVWINRSVVEADVRIGVGSIVPHCVAGWSGGGKIIYPGVAGEQTVDGFHGEFGTNLDNRIGNIDAPVRKEIERLVRYVGLEFIVNVILTGASSGWSLVTTSVRTGPGSNMRGPCTRSGAAPGRMSLW
jgi:nickel-dependent lactate racemase